MVSWGLMCTLAEYHPEATAGIRLTRIVQNTLNGLAAIVDRHFRHGSFLRSVATLSSGSAIGNVILLATTPVISRLYAPDMFGIFSVFLSVFTIGSVFATLNLHIALPLPRRDGTAANLLVSCFFVLGIFTLISILLVIASGDFRDSIPVIRDVGMYAVWLPAAFFSAGANVVLYYWLLRRRDYGSLAIIKVGQSGVMAGSQIGIGIFSGSALGLIVGHILSQLVGALASAWRVWGVDKSLIRYVSVSRTRRAFAAYREFSLQYTPGFFISTLSLMLPPILLTGMFGVAAAGLYAFTTRAIRGGLSLIVQSVTRVAYLRCVELHNAHDYVQLLSFYLKLCGRLALIGIIPFSLLFFFGDDIFALVFGENWRQAGVIAAYLVPGLYSFLVLDHSLHIFVIMKRQHVKFLWELSRFSMVAAVFILGYFLKLEVMTVVLGLSAAQTLAYGVVFFLCVRIIDQGDVKRPRHS